MYITIFQYLKTHRFFSAREFGLAQLGIHLFLGYQVQIYQCPNKNLGGAQPHKYRRNYSNKYQKYQWLIKDITQDIFKSFAALYGTDLFKHSWTGWLHSHHVMPQCVQLFQCYCLIFCCGYSSTIFQDCCMKKENMTSIVHNSRRWLVFAHRK